MAIDQATNLRIIAGLDALIEKTIELYKTANADRKEQIANNMNDIILGYHQLGYRVNEFSVKFYRGIADETKN